MLEVSELKIEVNSFRELLNTCDKENNELMLEGFPIMSCKFATLLLAYHLLDKWPALVIIGVYGFTHDGKGDETISHYWLEVDNVAIDITADQYNLLEGFEVNDKIVKGRPYNSVYVGQKGKIPQYGLFNIKQREQHVAGFPEIAEDFLDSMKVSYSQLNRQIN